MSKAEERACQYTGYCRNQSYKDYINGYRQAEKDLELSWKDFVLVRLAFDATEANINLGSLKISPMTKEYYEEVLKQFKDFRERKEK